MLKNIKPTANPPPFPNDFAKLTHNIIDTIILAIGTNNSNISHGDIPEIWNNTTVLYIGIIDAQPGFPAFSNNFHRTIILKTNIAMYNINSGVENVVGIDVETSVV